MALCNICCPWGPFIFYEIGGAGGIEGGAMKKKLVLKGGPSKKISSVRGGHSKNYPKILLEKHL